MLHSSLDRPADPYAPPELGYSQDVERRLLWAYRFLAASADLPDAYLRAHRLAFSCLGREMSARQQMRVFYVLGSSLIASEAPESGIACLEQAIADAAEVRDDLAWAELAYLAGSAERSLFHHASAHKHFAAALSLLDGKFHQDGPTLAKLAANIALGDADCSFLQGDYWGATRHLAAARTLFAHASDQASASPELFWMEALVLRWDAQPEEALVQALEASDIYEQAATPTERLSNGRLQSVITDIGLDVVERLPTGTARDALLTFAAPLPTRAREAARSFADEIGVHLATLAQARWDRLAGRNSATLEAIWEVVVAAEQIGDVALLAQAHTAMGDDLISLGWREPGLTHYRQTLHALRFTEVPAMGKWARDKLIESSRQR